MVFEEVEVKDGVLQLKLEVSAKRATISGLSIANTTYSSNSNLRMKQIEAETQEINEDRNDNESKALVSLYPNPSVDQIYLISILKKDTSIERLGFMIIS